MIRRWTALPLAMLVGAGCASDAIVVGPDGSPEGAASLDGGDGATGAQDASVDADGSASSRAEAGQDVARQTMDAGSDVTLSGDVEAGGPADGQTNSGDADAAGEAGATEDAGDASQVALCTSGGSCNAGDCLQGAWACTDGGAVCETTGTLEAGTPCGAVAADAGASHVCSSSGTCVVCNAGANCADAGSCEVMTIGCGSGSPVCEDVGPAGDGTSCSATPPRYCYGGICSACVVGAACTPSANACNVGRVTACSGGVATCTDQGVAASAGTSCTSASVSSGVCDGQGACVACTPNATCHPNACQSGIETCTTGFSCGNLTAVNEGQPCDSTPGSICHAGVCGACDSASCPNGCCGTAGCVVVASENNTSCGTGGAQCAPCPSGSSCQAGQCAGSELSLAPLQYSFTVTALGSTSASHAFVVTNSGNGASSALTTGLGGADPTDFVIDSDSCNGATVAAHGSCAISVSFAPTARGSRAASLSVNGGSLSAALTGVGETFLSLSVSKSGTGNGTVSDNTGALNCGTTCSAQYAWTTDNPVVSLTATPDGSSVFAGWSGGGCSGTATNCAVTLTAATTVNAEFTPRQTALTVNFHGLGTQAASIASNPAGISCSGASCTSTANFDVGTAVTLTVTQASGAIIAWSTGCTGVTCGVTMTASNTVNVTTTNQNIVFVSSQEHNGNFGGVSGADVFCNGLAAAAGVPGRFVAFLGTSTASAFSRLGSSRGWIRPDGLAFTDTVSGFQNSTMWYPASVAETGATLGFPVFTGVSAGVGTCGDWTATSGLGNGGVTWDEGINFFSLDGQACQNQFAVVCFGTDFSVPVSVNQVTGRHVFISTGAFVPSGGLSGADALCQSEAAVAGLANPTHFLAALGTTTASAASRFNLSGLPWVRTDGVLVATTTSNFMSGTLLAPPAVDRNGVLSTQAMWIGAAGGLADPAGSINEDCDNWSSASASYTADLGYPQVGEPDAFTVYSFDPFACNTSPAPSLICMEN